jgi:glycosyltransferase involved in cell wall biosynthesis
VIIVLDGWNEDMASYAMGIPVRIMSIPGPRGPAAARNRGALEAKGDVLFFMDSDVVIPSSAIAQIKTAFQTEPHLAALFGSYDDSPYQTNFLSQYKNLFHHYVHQHSRTEASTFWAGCGAIRREIFLRTGGFSEAYRRPSIEDIELGYRLKKQGYRIRLLKDLQVTHLKHWGVLSLLDADFFCRALPWTMLLLKQGGFIDDLNLTISSRVSVTAVYLLIPAIAGALRVPWLLLPAVLLILLLLGLNWHLYRFFREKRGMLFALGTIPWHWLYLFYSGLAFGLGLLWYGMIRVMPVKKRRALREKEDK